MKTHKKNIEVLEIFFEIKKKKNMKQIIKNIDDRN